MATIIQVNYPNSSNYEMKVEATESSVNVSSNTSLVTANLYIRRKTASPNGTYNLYGSAWSITIDGTTTNETKAWDLRNTSEWRLISTVSKTVIHNADGSKTISISASHTGNSGTMGTASGSGTMTLTTIPRTSKVSLSLRNFNIGVNITINTNRASSSFTHTAVIKFNGSTVITQTGIGASYTWNTAELYTYIPNSNRETGTVELTTYSGNTAIGTSSVSFTANVVNSNPTFSNFECEDTNNTILALTGNNQKYIKKYSNLKVTISSSNKMIARNGATAKSYNVIAGDKSSSVNYSSSTISAMINNINSNTAQVFAIDSRNNQTPVTKSLDIIDYSEVFLQNIQFERKNGVEETVNIIGDGTWKNVDFGQVQNSIDTFVFRTKKKTETTYSEWYSILNLFDIDINGTIRNKVANEFTAVTFEFGEEYDIQIKIEDKLSTVTKNTTVSSGKILMSALKRTRCMLWWGVRRHRRRIIAN